MRFGHAPRNLIFYFSAPERLRTLRGTIFTESFLQKNSGTPAGCSAILHLKLAIDELHSGHLDGGGGLVVPVGADRSDLIHNVHAGNQMCIRDSLYAMKKSLDWEVDKFQGFVRFEEHDGMLGAVIHLSLIHI